jgi:hypothetical protein
LFTNWVDGDNLPGLAVNGATFQFLGRRMFSWAPRKLYLRVAFSDCCEVGGKCQHISLELNNDLQIPCV